MFFKILSARKVLYGKSAVMLSIWCILFYQCEKVFAAICCLVGFFFPKRVLYALSVFLSLNNL